MKNFYNKGINIIEVIIVVAVLGIILAVAVPGFSNMKKAQVLKSSAQDIFSVLNKARSETLASLNSSEYGVHFQSDKIVFFKGTVYSANDANNENISFTSPAYISNISLTGGAINIYFSRLTGNPNVSGNITVSVGGSQTKTISISTLGAININ